VTNPGILWSKELKFQEEFQMNHSQQY